MNLAIFWVGMGASLSGALGTIILSNMSTQEKAVTIVTTGFATALAYLKQQANRKEVWSDTKRAEERAKQINGV